MHADAHPVRLDACRLNLGELGRLTDYGYFHPEFDCRTADGATFTARMRLHITEPLDPLIIVDPRAFADEGVAANSVGSTVLPRRADYTNDGNDSIALSRCSDRASDADAAAAAKAAGAARGARVQLEPAPATGDEPRPRLFRITADQMLQALRGVRPGPASAAGPIDRLAVTCHDPQVIGGGNAVLFRYITWLERLGVPVTVYSCGRPPTWMRVPACFRHFDSYAAMAAAIEEPAVLVYSIWHIEALARHAASRRLIGLRQGVERFQYGIDAASSRAAKPVIDLLERVTDDSVVVSPFLETFYQRELGIRSHLVPNGIDVTTFTAAPARIEPVEQTARAEAAERVERSEKSERPRKIILTVGDPTHFLKGARVMADALCLIAASRPDWLLTWRVVGGDVARPMALGRTQPANVICERAPHRTPLEMRDAYLAADLFVNPSLTEGFGLPTLEAMACGRPVVQADNGGLSGIAIHDTNCLMVPTGDAPALAAAIDRCLSDETLSRRLAAAGRATAARYSERAQFDAFAGACATLLGQTFAPDAINQIRASIADPADAADAANTAVAARAAELTSDARQRQPLVSVVMPTYNQAAYLPAALDSVLAQTYPHWEAVVVNDGSTDGTADVLATYAARDPRIRVITQTNHGITATLNKGLAHARGEFFCWLSSDDLFYPDKLRLQVRAFASLSREHALVYGTTDWLYDATGELQKLPPVVPLASGTELAEALRFDFIDGCSVMIRMAALREAGGFNGRYRHAQDMELWVRLAACGFRFHALPDTLNIRRVHEQQSSTTNLIHTRYDAAAIVAFYLDRYRLAELYPYLDLDRPADLQTAFAHAASRASHVEANVNFPLNRRRYLRWLIDGLRALPPESRRIALGVVIDTFTRTLDEVPAIHDYLDACLAVDVDAAATGDVPHDRRVADRSIVRAAAFDAAYAEEIYAYAIALLRDPNHTPLFAQALTQHDTNRLVDTPFKLAHSAIRYLAQFPNPVRDRVSPFREMSHVPAHAGDARQLAARLGDPASARVAASPMASSPVDVARRAGQWLTRERPLISVLVPTYNHARFLPAALDSLRAQTYAHWEAIVVDDGSTDETSEVLDRYARLDGRIRAHRRANGGVASALNDGLRRAAGEWICWLSSDDLFEPDKLRVHVNAARSSSARAFFTRFRYLSDRSGTVSEPELWQPAPEPAFQLSRHLLGPYIHGNSVAVHRSVFARVGGFDEGAAWAQDYDMWLRIASVERWQYLPDRTCITRLHDGQATQRFPEAGQFEGAFSASRFLNTHEYAALYPFVDLTSPDGVRGALRDTASIARNRQAIVHRGGYNTTLIEQLINWLAHGCAPALREIARHELIPLVRWLPSLPDGDRLRQLLVQAVDGSINGWRFLPVDPRDRAMREIQALRTAGDAAAAASLSRYLEATEKLQRAPAAPRLPFATTPVRGASDPSLMMTTSTANGTGGADATPREPEFVFDLDHVRTVAVFGAARNGKVALELAQRCGWTVSYIVDNNESVWGSTLHGLPVASPDRLTADRVDLVLIASHAHLDPISRQLNALGLVHGADYVSFLAPIQVGSVRLRVTL